MHIPIGLQIRKDGIELTFTDKLEGNSVADINNYTIKTWDLIRSRKYGSKHYNEQILEVTNAVLSKDKKSIILTIPNIKPTWVMEIDFHLKSEKGEKVDGLIQNTIHQLGENP
jgi:hypothetical protein